MSRDGKDGMLLVRILPLGVYQTSRHRVYCIQSVTDCIVLIHTLLMGDIYLYFARKLTTCNLLSMAFETSSVGSMWLEILTISLQIFYFTNYGNWNWNWNTDSSQSLQYKAKSNVANEWTKWSFWPFRALVLDLGDVHVRPATWLAKMGFQSI